MSRYEGGFSAADGWVDASSQFPYWFDRVVYCDGGWMIPEPDQGEIGMVTNSGARAAAWREFPAELAADVAATCTWTGQRPFEGSPLIHVNPDSDAFGIGLWPIADFAKTGDEPHPTWVLGMIGRIPSLFRALPDAWTTIDHVDGTPRRMELRSTGTHVSAWVDGVMIIGPVDLPAGLIGSSCHGVCLDVNQHPDRPARVPVLTGPLEVRSLTDGESTAG